MRLRGYVCNGTVAVALGHATTPPLSQRQSSNDAAAVATHPADLWSALTDPRHLTRWYGEVAGDLRPGGEFRLHLESEGWDGTGRVDGCESPRSTTRAPLVTSTTLSTRPPSFSSAGSRRAYVRGLLLEALRSTEMTLIRSCVRVI